MKAIDLFHCADRVVNPTWIFGKLNTDSKDPNCFPDMDLCPLITSESEERTSYVRAHPHAKVIWNIKKSDY